MALTPPNNNQGDFNTSNTGPDVWDEVQSTNHQIIDRNDMPFASTVEYTGYYKAEATGEHNFSLSGSSGVTGYAWISGAPRGSDHIKLPNSSVAETLFNKSYGVIIPNNRGTGYWVFADSGLLGSFPGYGYWPKENYGTAQGFRNLYNGQDAPSNACGFTQVEHQYLLPGDIRTFENAPVTNFGGRQAGPGWQGPEDPNFTDPCWPDGGASQPLQRICRNTDDRPCNSSATPNTPGKTTQVFLDTSFKAEGISDTSWAQYEITQDNRQGELDGGEVYIWPKAVSVYRTANGKGAPERVNVRFGIRFNQAGEYTFKFKSRDGLKMWYMVGGGDSRDMQKFPDDIGGGSNPCNLTAGGTPSSTSWKPGAGADGFTGKVNLANLGYIQFIGHAVGVPGQDTHGWSLVVEDSSGVVVWDTSALIVGGEDQLIGIDECGYNALLGSGDRTPSLKVSEFYKSNGWAGYVQTGEEEVFVADASANDNVARSPSTTRQYLWSNSLAKTRGGQSIPGTIYLRQGDYYFIRAILSNDQNQTANFRFTVTSPASGASQSVRFTGNGDPSLDTGIGGNAGGNGIPISASDLCDSVLAPGGQAIANNDTNFALLDDLNVVLNLNVLNVSDDEIGREGQSESLSEGGQGGDPGSKLITFTDPNDTNNTELITLSQLVRGGKPGPNGLEPLNSAQRNIVFAVYQQQAFPSTGSPVTLSYNTFKSAITSQAVKQWGLTGNYPYIYHAVSDVITSICTGVDITVPEVVLNTAGDLSLAVTGASGAGKCIDLDVTQLSSSGVQITTECLNDCKTPNQFAMLTGFYTKSQSQFTGMASSYYSKVRVEPEYGMSPPTGWSSSDASNNGDYDISVCYAQYDGAFFRPGTVTAIPLTIPDVFVPDNFPLTSGNGALECGFRFEISSNTFQYDPDNIGVNGEYGVDGPYMVWWTSATPGGPRTGEYYILNPLTSRNNRMWSTMSYDQWVADSQSSSRSFYGYLGNTNGVRWWNVAPLKKAEIQALDFNIPEAGTQAFVDLLSVKGFSTNEIRIFGTVTSPDCDALAAGPSGSSSSNPTMRSLPNMAPYIGEEWDGNVPGHVEIATNGGYWWSAGAGNDPYPAGIGPGNESPRLTGNAVWFPQPTNGKILSYEWQATNEKIVPQAQYTWVWSPGGGQQVLSFCSPPLTVVRWFSATPGGTPLLAKNGSRPIFNIGDAAVDPNFTLQQLYDINDVQGGYEGAPVIPVITKKYFLNAAAIESSLYSTLASEGRAPTASEVRVYSPPACGSSYSYAYVVGGPRGTIYDFEEWLQENT